MIRTLMCAAMVAVLTAGVLPLWGQAVSPADTSDGSSDVQPIGSQAEAPGGDAGYRTAPPRGEPKSWNAEGGHGGMQPARGGFIAGTALGVLFALVWIGSCWLGPAIVSLILAGEKGRSPVAWLGLGLIPVVGWLTTMYLLGTTRHITQRLDALERRLSETGTADAGQQQIPPMP